MREEIVSFLNTKIKDITVDPDKKWITTWNDYLWRINTSSDGFITIKW